MASYKFNSSQAASGIVVPLFVLVAGLGVYFFVLPKYRDLKASREVYQTKQADLNDHKSSLSGIKALVKSFKDNEQKLEPADGALPDAPRIPELLANFDFLVQKSGMLVTNIQMTLPVGTEKISGGPRGASEQSKGPRMDGLISSTDNVGIIQIDLDITGPYGNFKTFALNLQQNLRLMDISAITSGTGGGDEQENQQYALKIYTYYQK